MTSKKHAQAVTLATSLVFLLVIVVGLSSGCDTVAEISFKQRSFQGFTTIGMVNANNCTQTDTEVLFRFTPFDGDNTVIAEREQVNDEVIVLRGADKTFGTEDISFSGAVLYPSPDIPCGSDADCSALTGFRCHQVNPFQSEGSQRVCGRDIEVEVFQGDVSYVVGEDIKSIAVLMDHSRTLEGVGEDGVSFARDRSTDPQDVRISASRAFVSKFARTSFAEDSEVCVVSYGGEGAAAVRFSPTPSACLTDDLGDVDSFLSQLSIGETGASPIWAAVVESVNQQVGSAPGERIIVLFTDGLDDGSVSNMFADAHAAVTGNNVTVHVVQLDNPPEVTATSTIPYVGPDDEFSRLACDTFGSIQYAVSPDDLRPYFDNLALGVSSYYEVRAQVATLSELPGGAYRLAARVQITMAGTQRSLELAGDKTDPSSRVLIDDRMTVFTRPVPARPDPMDDMTME